MTSCCLPGEARKRSPFSAHSAESDAQERRRLPSYTRATGFPIVAALRGGLGSPRMSDPIVFASTCPQCKRDQPQDDFTVADLLRLLDGGYPIEGYCVICNKFWPLSLRERVRLGELVAAVQRDSLPPEDDDQPRLPRSD